MIWLGRCLAASMLILGALASSGDRAQDFTSCVSRCERDRCGSLSYGLPMALQMTRWTCTDDCKYTCMHEITDREIARNARVQQYYGKWPFWRLAGMQEPASVAFSLLNLWAHARGGMKIQKRLPATHPMKSYYLVWSLASINAWTWSAVFHTRGWYFRQISLTCPEAFPDLSTTEKLDYFSAALAIMYALYYTVIRLFHLYPSSQRSRLTLSSNTGSTWSLGLKAWTCLCTVAYLAHISYLTLLPRFDYTYNMAFNLVLGLTHNGLWLLYSLPASFSVLQRFPSRAKSYRPQFAGKAAVFVVLTTAATALELFDFPPWGRIIDAHALWHLSTVPIALTWYDFLVADSLDISWREQTMYVPERSLPNSTRC